jgi:hypothetical protein
MEGTKLVVEGWNSVSDKEKAQIEFILKSSGAVSGDFTIEADPTKPEFAAAESFEKTESWFSSVWVDNVRGPLCRTGCDTAAATAAAACTGISSGAGVAACIAAAELARQVCRRNCPS